MSTKVQFRRGTTTEHSTFTGALGEVTVDTTKDVVVVHDGATAGGFPAARENLSNVPAGTITSTMIADGTIVNADVNASAAIAGSKISPDFGAQNVTTTGTVTGASLTPSSSTVPTNGVYLPAANTVGVATNGTGRLFVDSAGYVTIGTTDNPAAAQLMVTKAGGAQGFEFLPGSATTVNTVLHYNRAGSAYLTSTVNALDHIWQTSGSERLRITSAGLVGIGVTGPQAIFHSKAGATTSAGIFESGSASGSFLSFVDTGSSSYTRVQVGSVGNELVLRTTDTERVRITSGGLVGIGTTSPGSYSSAADDLVVAGSGDTGITIAAGSSSYSSVYFADGTTGSEPYRGIVGYNHASDELVFYTAGLLRSTIDSAGRLLVGTSSGQGTALLQVEGSTTSSTNWGTLFLRRGQEIATIGANVGTSLGQIDFGSRDGAVGATILAQSDATWSTAGSGDYPGRLVFSTTADGASSPTERLRIGSSGTVLTYSTDDCISARASQGAGTSYFFYRGMQGASSTTAGGTTSFIVYTNGNVQNTNNSYGSISDVKLKENIVDANSQWDDLKALQVRKYNFKEGQTHTQIGLVAQEVELVSPGLVTESPDRDTEGNDLGTVTKSVNYSVLYMKAVKALQEAMERIETLEAKVAALESA